MPEHGTRPVNQYLPPRPKDAETHAVPPLQAQISEEQPQGFLGWLDRALEHLD